MTTLTKRIGLNFCIESFYFIIVSVRKSRLKDRCKVASNVTGEQAPARYTVLSINLSRIRGERPKDSEIKLVYPGSIGPFSRYLG